MPSSINARHSKVDAKNPDKVFIFNESIIPENTATCSVYKVSTSECLSNPRTKNTGIADFTTFLNVLKNQHKGFEIRLLQKGKKAINLWLDAKYVLRTLATPNKIHAHGIADVYAYLSELNDAGRNVYAVINHTDYEPLRSDMNASKVFKWRVAKDKHGKIRRKPDGKPYRECYDPATHKKAFKVSSTKDSHINGYNFLFVDRDTPQTGTQSNFEMFMNEPVTPALVVQTSEAHKLQVYYRVDGIENAAQFRKLQKALISKFDGDKVVHNAARIMRIAGFKHVKNINNPMWSKVLHSEDTAPIPVNDFIEAMQLEISTPQKPSKTRKKIAKVNTSNKTTDNAAQEPASKDLPFDIEVLLANAIDLDDFIQKLKFVYPVKASYRHYLCLWSAGEMLLRFNVSEQDALETITAIAEANADEEINDRETTVHTTYARHANGEPIKGIRSQKTFRNFKQCFYSKTTAIKGISKKELSRTAYRRVITTLFHNQLADGVLGAFSLRKLSELAGVSYDTARNKMNELIEKKLIHCISKNNDRTYIYRIELNKINSTDLLAIESEPSAEDMQRLQHKVNNFNDKRQEYKNNLQNLKNSKTVTSAKVEDIDTVYIDVTREAPAIAAPSDHSQKIVKPPSDYADVVSKLLDGDYAETPALLANAPP